MAGDFKLVFDYENGNLKQVTGEAESEFSKSGKRSGTKFGKGFNEQLGSAISGSIGRNLKRLGALVAGVGSVTLFKSIKDAATLETIETQFTTILKSASAAQKQIEDLQDFAASTPFQLEGLSTSTRQLLSFGVAQQDIIPTLRQLGDLAAGTGANIEELTIPFGRLVSTQKLTLVELDKFADRGINLYGELAKQTGRSLAQIRDDISKGRVPFDEFTTALTNLTSEGGTFFGATEARSRTLSGVLSTLGDNLFNISANFGKAFSPVIISVVDNLTKRLQDFNSTFVKNFDVFDDLIFPLLDFNDAVIKFAIAPLELLLNVGNLVAAGVNSAFARIISGIGNLGLGIATVLDKLGIGDELSAGLKAFEETSEQVADEVGQDFETALGKINDFSISDGLSQKNEELRGFFQEQRDIIAENTAATNEETNKNVDAITDKTAEAAQATSSLFGFLRVSASKTAKDVSQQLLQTSNIIKNQVVRGISGSIQQLVNNIAQGKDAFNNLGNFILGVFGDLAIQLGEFFIAQGIAVEALKAVSGTGAIVAGAALIALGTLLKNATGGSSGAGSASSSGSFSSSPAFAPQQEDPSTAFVEESGQAATPQTVLNISVEGNVVDSESFTRQLIEDIGTEGSRQGLVFDNFRTT